jgi:hypothetical protein
LTSYIVLDALMEQRNDDVRELQRRRKRGRWIKCLMSFITPNKWWFILYRVLNCQQLYLHIGNDNDCTRGLSYFPAQLHVFDKLNFVLRHIIYDVISRHDHWSRHVGRRIRILQTGPIRETTASAGPLQSLGWLFQHFLS